jgi:hypothetical protein
MAVEAELQRRGTAVNGEDEFFGGAQCPLTDLVFCF